MSSSAVVVVVGMPAVVKSSDLVARRLARQAYERPWLQKPKSKFDLSIDRVCRGRCRYAVYAVYILPYTRRRRWLLLSVDFLLFDFLLQVDVAIARIEQCFLSMLHCIRIATMSSGFLLVDLPVAPFCPEILLSERRRRRQSIATLYFSILSYSSLPYTIQAI